MGQAKNRKAEIAALKAQPKLLSFGAFYKANEDHGFSVNFCQEQVDVASLSKMLSEQAKGYLTFVKKPNESIEDFVKFIKDQTLELCDAINYNLYGSSIQGSFGTRKSVDLSAEMKNIIMFMLNVLWLTENGHITNDDNNGLMYCYEG